MYANGAHISTGMLREVWAALTLWPCIPVRTLAHTLHHSTTTIRVALYELRNAGYIAFEDSAHKARTIIVPFYVIEGT